MCIISMYRYPCNLNPYGWARLPRPLDSNRRSRRHLRQPSWDGQPPPVDPNRTREVQVGHDWNLKGLGHRTFHINHMDSSEAVCCRLASSAETTGLELNWASERVADWGPERGSEFGRYLNWPQGSMHSMMLQYVLDERVPGLYESSMTECHCVFERWFS